MNTIALQPNNPYASINIALLQARESVLSYYRPALKQAGITEQQWRIIRLLAENGTLDFQDLAAKSCILRPSLTGILSRLEQADLIVRLKPANDHRKVFLKLTAQGKRMFDETSGKLERDLSRLQQAFCHDEMSHLVQLLSQLHQYALPDDGQ